MYALCILIGIVVAVWLTGRRLVPRGGEPGQALDVAAYAVLFGIVGGRLYHVITTPGPYWGAGGHPLDALKVWEGGLGIWGAISLGALGAWIGCRRAGHQLPRLRRRRRARRRVRPGHRPVRQLVQQRALRRPDDAAVGPGDPRVGPVRRPGRGRRGGQPGGARASSTRRSSTRPSSSSCSATALLVVDRRRTPRTGPAARPLRRRLPGRPDRHRDDAHRRGRAHPRPAAQRLDEHRRVPPRRLDLLVHAAAEPRREDAVHRWVEPESQDVG